MILNSKMLGYSFMEVTTMIKYLHCECCGGGDLADLRKEIYENNGGSYHLALSFNGSKRVFRCTECGKIWWTEPTSEFMHYLSENIKVGKIISIDREKSLKTSLRTG